MLVQIWTHKGYVSNLDRPIPLSGLPAANGTANDMHAPGSFPYPVTVTVDRHGGDAQRKGIYCYGLGHDHRIMDSVRMWIAEDRAFGGKLVNPAAVPGANRNVLERRYSNDGYYGGIDGGAGGCSCQWQNWH
jgi:hypothetical protein